MTIFSRISRCISETVIVRWAHAARQFVSIDFFFHPYNIQLDCPRSIPRENTVADHPTNQSSAYERSFSDADVDSGEEQDDLVTPGEQQDGDISSEPEFLDETGRLTVYKLQLMWRSSLSTPSSSVYGHLGARIQVRIRNVHFFGRAKLKKLKRELRALRRRQRHVAITHYSP